MTDDNKPPRKGRIDSTAEQMRIAQGVNRVISPPDNIVMTDDDLFFFDQIIDERPRADWTDHQISLACYLARSMNSLNKNQHRLSLEGELIRNRAGDAIQSPRKKSVEDTISSIVAMRRNLGLHARAIEGEKRDMDKRRAIAKDFENIMDDPLELFATSDDLLN
jgi:hypothetical protein